MTIQERLNAIIEAVRSTVDGHRARIAELEAQAQTDAAHIATLEASLAAVPAISETDVHATYVAVNDICGLPSDDQPALPGV